jgi:hypothetical protein
VPPTSATTDPSATSSSLATTTSVASTTTLTPPTPSTVSVAVLNGTSTPGAAGFFTNKLKVAGYDTLSPSDASADTATSTLVVVTPQGTKAAGEAVAVALGLSLSSVTAAPPSSAPIPSGALSGADVVVLVGSDIASQALGVSSSSGASSTTLPAPAGGSAPTTTVSITAEPSTSA